MESEKERSSFRHFSEQLRVENAAFSSLSLSDSIWSDPFVPDNDDRRSSSFLSSPPLDFPPGDWNLGLGPQKLAFSNFGHNRVKNNDEYSSKSASSGGFLEKNGGFSNGNGLLKNCYSSGKKNIGGGDVAGNRKNGNSNHGVNKNRDHGIDKTGNGNGCVDKRFRTLPASEALPRSEAVGGYIFVCNNDTMQENLERQLFGLPSRYKDSVRAITPGLPLFLYNYSTHQLYGIFEAASFGGTNIDPLAWQDKKKPGESRFPAQVRVVSRKLYYPLEEDSFRPFLHHYDGPKFRLELSIPEALALLDIFSEKNV